MKIALIGNDAKGLMLFRLDFIKTLVAQGHQVTAYFPDTAEEPADIPKACQLLEQAGASPCPVPLQRTGLNPLADLSYRRHMKQRLKALGPHLVLAYGIKPILHGLPAAKAAGVPVRTAMITGLGSAFIEIKTLKQRLVHWVARAGYSRALALCQHVFFQNQDDLADFRAMKLIRAHKPVSLIAGSGVNMQLFARRELPDISKTLRFIFVGRLIKHKGLLEYLEAAQLLLQGSSQGNEAKPKVLTPDVLKPEFWVVGGEDPNPSALKLEALKQSYPAVKFFGPVTNVAELLAQAHVYVLPSYREGTPRSALEAMATGRAVITTDTPGCRAVVAHNQSGLIVPAQDSEALKAAMQQYLSAPDLCLSHGQQGFQRVTDMYDVEKVNQSLVDVLDNLAGTKDRHTGLSEF